MLANDRSIDDGGAGELLDLEIGYDDEDNDRYLGEKKDERGAKLATEAASHGHERKGEQRQNGDTREQTSSVEHERNCLRHLSDIALRNAHKGWLRKVRDVTQHDQRPDRPHKS